MFYVGRIVAVGDGINRSYTSRQMKSEGMNLTGEPYRLEQPKQ
ncbi:MAG: hypothetical protein ACF8OB_12105 [Phycisphaeraceae bacterium JB051]